MEALGNMYRKTWSSIHVRDDGAGQLGTSGSHYDVNTKGLRT